MVEPATRAIRHVNVHQDGRVCLSAAGEYQNAWECEDMPLGERSLTGLLNQVQFVLKGENYSSPAR